MSYKKSYKLFASVLNIAIATVMSVALYMQSYLPDHFSVTDDSKFEIPCIIGRITLSAKPLGPAAMAGSSLSENLYANLNIFGVVPVKQISIKNSPRKLVIPGGNVFGIKMFTDGVIVVGLANIPTEGGEASPARQCGLRIGDILMEIDGSPVMSNKDVAQAIASKSGEKVAVKYRRKNDVFTTFLTPARAADGSGFKGGIWVRDSSAGIGTMTYYDMENRVFAGLGHGVCDVDTGTIMPLFSGEIVEVVIDSIKRGESGYPGELKGTFHTRNQLGELVINSEVGVFGRTSSIPDGRRPVELAMRQEVSVGPAKILATIDEDNIGTEFDIEIEKINYADSTPTKNMIIRVTDKRLKERTGGIVQGMSGCPIIQNGRLVGAVTHVLVNDPSKGYGIFVENMEKNTKVVADLDSAFKAS